MNKGRVEGGGWRRGLARGVAEGALVELLSALCFFWGGGGAHIP